MTSERLYHLSRDGKPLGKYDESVMRELLRIGKLRPTDDYWTPGMKAWAKLAILPQRRATTATHRPVAQPARPAAAKPTQSARRKIQWLKLWPVPALVLLASLLGYSASRNQETGNPPAPARKETAKKQPIPQEAPSERIELTKGFGAFHPMGKELFPSHVIAFANTRLKPVTTARTDSTHYGNPDFIAGVLIAEPKSWEKITVEVTADRFIRPSIVSFTVKHDTHSATAGPAPLFDFEGLSKVRQTTPFNVTIKVQRNGDEPVVFTETWQAHQLNDCPNRLSVLSLSDAKGLSITSHNAGRVLAGYVNENHPMIDEILAEAKATGVCASFTGYGEGGDDIIRQIQAVWTALQKRGITYSNTADTTRSPLHSFQHVRMLDQCLKSGQANCVDATVMLASILKKIGLNVGIILVPNHAYLVVYDKTGKKREFAVESTGIAHSTLREAIKAATEDELHSLRKIQSKLDDGTDDQYHEVSVEDCRRSGIQPIPYSP
jgi:hypothetical protein